MLVKPSPCGIVLSAAISARLLSNSGGILRLLVVMSLFVLFGLVLQNVAELGSADTFGLIVHFSPRDKTTRGGTSKAIGTIR